jgi:hypothetical protein
MRGLNQSGLRLPRVGEGATLKAEQLRFEQAVWNRCAIDVYEWSTATGTPTVDQAREQTFARARFTLQQYRWQALRALFSGDELLGLFAHGSNSRAYTEQRVHRGHATIVQPPGTTGYW